MYIRSVRKSNCKLSHLLRFPILHTKIARCRMNFLEKYPFTKFGKPAKIAQTNKKARTHSLNCIMLGEIKMIGSQFIFSSISK